MSFTSHIYLSSMLMVFASGLSTRSTASTSRPHVPFVYGMRVEGAPKDNNFGFSPTGKCSISVERQYKVVLYGDHLSTIKSVHIVNASSNHDVFIVDSVRFITHFDDKIAFALNIPDKDIELYIRLFCSKNGYLQLNGTEYELTTSEYAFPREFAMPLGLEIAILVFLIGTSALFSGLTIGLMTLTVKELEIVQKTGSESERMNATIILPIRRRGNQLLCTLLLGNTVCNTVSSILLTNVLPEHIAMILSTVVILLVGEILPQSICVNKGLDFGAKTIVLTQSCLFLFFPIAWPISKLLDRYIGFEAEGFDRNRLRELIKLEFEQFRTSEQTTEYKIIEGAFGLRHKIAENAMKNINEVYMLSDTAILNAKVVAEIVRMGYTRIPVYFNDDRNNVTDVLIVKDLALLDPDDNFTVRTVCGYYKHPVHRIPSDMSLLAVLELFKKGDSHLAMVTVPTSPDKIIGIVTLEDIVEEILQADIKDEFDGCREKNKPTTMMLLEEGASVQKISSHVLVATAQYLVANEEPFTEKYIDKMVLERLILNCVRRVNLSYMKTSSDTTTAHMQVPAKAKLYTKGELSDRFVLILEGRAQVTIGQTGMMFEAGPFHRFGSELLRKIVKNADNFRPKTDGFGSKIDSPSPSAPDFRREQYVFRPDFSVVVTDDCTFLEVSVDAFVHALRTTMMQRRESTPSTSRTPLVAASSRSETSTTTNSSIASIIRKKSSARKKGGTASLRKAVGAAKRKPAAKK